MRYGKARDEEIPVLAEVMRAATEARRLNRFMNEKILLYDDAAIQAALDAFDVQLRKDCEAIAGALGLAKIGPTVDLYLILQEPTPSPGWVAGAIEDAYVIRAIGTGKSFVRVLATPELAPFSNSSSITVGDTDLRQATHRLFPRITKDLLSVSLTNAHHAVASVLGYDDDSLRLRYPALSLAE